MSEGYTCLKGRAELERLYHPDRLLSSKKRINGKLVDIPSYEVRPGDVIAVRESSRKMPAIHEAMRRVREGQLLPWLHLDKAKMEGSMLELPGRADIPVTYNENLVVELYSK